MPADNFYILSALPSLGDLGSDPPVTFEQMLQLLDANTQAQTLVEVLFLSDDLLQRQAYLAGEIKDIETSVLTTTQACDQEPLPDYLVSAEITEQPQPNPDDLLWANYYRHADQLAQSLGSNFLTAWIGYEVALRNALVEARAKSLELDSERYQVAPELADAEQDFNALIQEWTAAADPLKGLRVLDRHRWDWLTEHQLWFTFANDELAAYAAKLILLYRWERINRTAPQSADTNSKRSSRNNSERITS